MTPGRLRTSRVALVAGAVALSATLVQVGRGAFGAEAAPAAPLISSAPIRPTISTRATFAFDQLPGLMYECAVDDGVSAACSSPIIIGGLSRSAHTFRVRARKPAGAVSSATAYSWAIVAPHRGTRCERRETPADFHDRPRAAMDLEERHVRVAAEAGDKRRVPTRRRPLAVVCEPSDVPRPRARPTRLSSSRSKQRGSSEHREPIHMDDHVEPSTSRTDHLIAA